MLNQNLILCCILLVYLNKPRVINGLKVSVEFNTITIVLNSYLQTKKEKQEVKGKGDKAIKSWINGQLEGKSCAVVLIGANTAGRPWIKYEIQKAWELGKGIVGINIHNLKDSKETQSSKGKNPFDDFTIDDKKLSGIVKVYNPPYKISTNVYNNIDENIESWVEEAISIRKNY